MLLCIDRNREIETDGWIDGQTERHIDRFDNVSNVIIPHIISL